MRLHLVPVLGKKDSTSLPEQMFGTSSRSAARSAYAAPTGTTNIAKRSNSAARPANVVSEHHQLDKFNTFTLSYATP